MGVSGGGFPWRLTTPPARRSLSFGRSGSCPSGIRMSLLRAFLPAATAPGAAGCAAENGNVAAALYWFDAEFRGQKFAYLYAVATHPDFRNRGLCRALMADAAACLTGRGYDGALLMPHDSGLRKMYGRMGYRDCCTVSEFSCDAGEAVALRPVSDAEFARLRREYLPRTA